MQELDRWLRERAVENVATCAATLQSLSALLGRIENLVINDDIGKQVLLLLGSSPPRPRHSMVIYYIVILFSH